MVINVFYKYFAIFFFSETKIEIHTFLGEIKVSGLYLLAEILFHYFNYISLFDT